MTLVIGLLGGGTIDYNQVNRSIQSVYLYFILNLDEMDSLADCQGQEESFHFDSINQILYIHVTHTENPFAQTVETGLLVGKEVEMPINPEDENSPTEMVYQPKSEIYIVEGRNNPKGLEEVIIKEITEEDEKRDADIVYLSIMTGVDLDV